MPVTVCTHMVATSDANVFEAAGYPAANLSGDDMHYLNLTWHTYDDRIELLDEGNLRQAFGLILGLALPLKAP